MSERDSLLVAYLCDKFYPNIDHQKELREDFVKLSLKEAIHELLFIRVEEQLDWKIADEHFVFEIKKGEYLSFTAQLFLLSLFLYKHEATQLISKIRGFKRSDDEFHYKRDIFTFFSKKISAQDIDSEERHLIRFRDIVQYLNHFPTVWNEYLSPERKNRSMTDRLERYVLEREIFRVFPSFKDCQRELFLRYAVNKLFPEKEGLLNAVPAPSDTLPRTDFDYEIETSLECKDVDRKLQEKLRYSDRAKYERRRRQLIKEVNPDKIKLQQKIREEKLLTIYGRNQDRFFEFAVRFLAEENYFGKDAAFKMYRYQTTERQEQLLNRLQEGRTRKDFEKLVHKIKYHQGRITRICTYKKHLANYPDWDDPFVIQDNAFQLVLTFSNGEKRKFSVQRKLLIYLLEDALFDPQGNIEGKGRKLLEDYYFNSLMPDFEEVKERFTESTISKKHRQLLPKRLLYTLLPAAKNDSVKAPHPFQKLLNEAEQQEHRYRLLYEKARTLGLDEEFIKRNKGKQFKMRFIRKAWHFLYFRGSYRQQVQLHGHHKSFHISKDEFNDFCRWMYALEEVPQYKARLKDLLQRKKFLDNAAFADLFEGGDSLEDFYNSTKEIFRKRIAENGFELKEDVAGQYDEILSKKIVYINLSHFIGYLKEQGRLKEKNSIIQYRALNNKKYLIDEYYYADVLSRSEFKENGALFSKLRAAKLEDALLYELAMKYLKSDSDILSFARTNVRDILSSEIAFSIKGRQGSHLYLLTVPFKKIEALAVLKRNKEYQEIQGKKGRLSFLENVSKMLTFLSTALKEDVRCDKQKLKHTNRIKLGGLEKILDEFGNSKGGRVLSFDQLVQINNYIISGAVKFSKIHMELERYYVLKYKIQKPNASYIDIHEINKGQHMAFGEAYREIRNKALHFGVPNDFIFEVELRFDKRRKCHKGDLKSKLQKSVEEQFINDEVKPQNASSFGELDKPSKSVCRVLMQILHNDLLQRGKERDAAVIRKIWEDRYFNEIVRMI